MPLKQFHDVMFTQFQYGENWKEYLKNLFETEQLQYLTGQLEKCPGTNRLHIQAYCELKKKKTFNSLKKLIPQANLEERQRTKMACIEYCHKTDTQVEPYVEYGTKKQQGTRHDLTAFAEAMKQTDKTLDEIILDPKNSAYYLKFHTGGEKLNAAARRHLTQEQLKEEYLELNLNEWQDKAIALLTNQDKRQILWIYDPKGNTGKSHLAMYLHFTYKAALFDINKKSDLAQAYNGENLIVFDIARSNQEYFNYSTAEDLKRGMLFSPKYMSSRKYVKDAKILIFSNERPLIPTKDKPTQGWSKDRYQVYKVTNGTLQYQDYMSLQSKQLKVQYENEDSDQEDDLDYYPPMA